MDELNAMSEDPTLWDDPKNAQEVMRERQALEDSFKQIVQFETSISDGVEMIELAELEDDQDMIAEIQAGLETTKKLAEKAQLSTLLSGEVDANSTYLEIHAGAGGTESCDWASMLFRMYVRWAEKRGYKVDTIEYQAGDEAGIKSVTIHIQGLNAHGWLKTESGVHRLVRISPFDSNAKRHTSFSSVWVYPEIDDTIEIDVADKDVRIDTYRASGAGGQHVNKTDSAVRITHLETNIVVQCQNDRSQHKNRATAWNMLRARLYEHEMKIREADAAEENASKSEIGWGHQIRSYVLQPYQMVKDARTQVESSNPSAVLDGDIDLFLEASLASKISNDDD